MSDSKVVDTQNGYEKALTSALVALSGSNFIHDAAGLVEFASTASYKQYVIDNEIIGMVMRAVRGIEVTDETIAVDVYRRVGPGGNFLDDIPYRSMDAKGALYAEAERPPAQSQLGKVGEALRRGKGQSDCKERF